MTLVDAGQAHITKAELNGDSPFPKRVEDRVCIVGFADGHRDLAPNVLGKVEPGTEYWGLNRLHAVMKDRKWHRWFEIHSLNDYYGPNPQRPDGDQEHIGWLRDFDGPIYLRPEDMPLAKEWGIRSAEPYLLRETLESFGRYFTNSVSYMIAYAIAMEYTGVSMFGVDMASDTLQQKEYREQRPSCEYLLGVAAGRGMEILLPPQSDLLRATHLYGFHHDLHRGKMLGRLQELGNRKENIKQQVAQLDAQRAQMIAAINQLDGAQQEIQYQVQTFQLNTEVADG